MTILTEFENNFHEVFQKAFPNIKITHDRYGDGLGLKYTQFLIPPQNKNLKGSNYYIDNKQGYYHFTNLNALQSIVSSGAIRLYNLNHLKDPREFQYAANLIPHGTDSLEDAKENFFILSFCENISEFKLSEKFNIWRLYGENGLGCIIKVKFVKNDLSNWNNFYLSKVYYGINDRHRINQISKALEGINKVNPNIGIDIGQVLCFHKSILYRSENEVRLLYDYRRVKKGYGQLPFYDSDMNVIFPIIRTEILRPFNPLVKYLELPIFHSGFSPIDDHIPILAIGQIIIGFGWKNHFNEIKQELTLLFRKKMGFVPLITLSKLSKTFWG